MSDCGDDHHELDDVSVHSTAKSEKSQRAPDGMDLDERDPNNLNDHVQVMFDDVLGEPEGAHSGRCIWVNSFRCFNVGKGCFYRVLTIICAIPLAFLWGCQFACVTFTHIWLVTPCFRLFDLNFDCIRRFWSVCVHCMYDPCCEAYSLMFSRVGLHYRDTTPRDGTHSPSGSVRSKRFNKGDFFGKKDWD